MNTERIAVRRAARLVKRSPTKIRQLIEAALAANKGEVQKS